MHCRRLGLAALTVAGALAIPQAAAAQQPIGDSVTANSALRSPDFGCQTFECTTSSTAIDAHSGPWGESRTGTF